MVHSCAVLLSELTFVLSLGFLDAGSGTSYFVVVATMYAPEDAPPRGLPVLRATGGVATRKTGRLYKPGKLIASRVLRAKCRKTLLFSQHSES
jgi:hypothetical protein